MNIDNIKTIFNEKKEVHFKLYSLDYTIKEVNWKVVDLKNLTNNYFYNTILSRGKQNEKDKMSLL